MTRVRLSDPSSERAPVQPNQILRPSLRRLTGGAGCNSPCLDYPSASEMTLAVSIVSVRALANRAAGAPSTTS